MLCYEKFKDLPNFPFLVLLANNSNSANTYEFGLQNKTDDSCECSDILDELVQKIEENYIVYYIELKDKREKDYLDRINTYKLKAKNSTKDECVKILKEFIEFYKDGHLYIGQFPRPDEEQVNKLIANAEVIDAPEKEVKAYLISNVKRLDPIEGIWFANDSMKYGVIRNITKQRDFVAFLLSECNKKWKLAINEGLKLHYSRLNVEQKEIDNICREN